MPPTLRFCLPLVLAVSLAACAGQRNPFETNPAPQNYKAEILAFLRTYLNDPTNVREASLSQPSQQRVAGADRYVVCVRFNARKSDGKYAGLINTAAVFSEGRLWSFVNLTPDETAADAAQRKQLGEVCEAETYQPFPELERLTR